MRTELEGKCILWRCKPAQTYVVVDKYWQW